MERRTSPGHRSLEMVHDDIRTHPIGPGRHDSGMTRLHTVHIANLGDALQVPAASTLLEAARSAGLPYPHGCRVGRCGACKSRLLSGEVEMLPHTPFSLTAADRERGFILACRAQPRSDCSVAWLGSDAADHPAREATGRVVSLSRPTPDITILRVALEGAPLSFSAGQFAELSFESCPSRTYSMANHPDDPLLEFHVRRMPGGITSGHVAAGLRVDDPVRLHGPLGHSHLRARRTGTIVAAAGGTGLAPILAILKAAAALRLTQAVRLYLFARDEAGFYAEEEIEALAPSLADFACHRLIGSREARIEAFANALPDLAGASAYVAGSPALVDSASAALTGKGLPAEHIFADAFVTSAELQSEFSC